MNAAQVGGHQGVGQEPGIVGGHAAAPEDGRGQLEQIVGVNTSF